AAILHSALERLRCAGRIQQVRPFTPVGIPVVAETTHLSDAAGKLAKKPLHGAQSRAQATIGFLLRIGLESVEALTGNAQAPVTAAYFHLHIVGRSFRQMRAREHSVGENSGDHGVLIIPGAVAAQGENLLHFRTEQVAPEVEEVNSNLYKRSSAICAAALPIGNTAIGTWAVPYGADRFDYAERTTVNI